MPNISKSAVFFQVWRIFFKCAVFSQVLRIFPSVPHFSKCGALFQVCCIFQSVPHLLSIPHFSQCAAFFLVCRICLQLISRPDCGTRLQRLLSGVACVRCYSHASFERGNSSIPSGLAPDVRCRSYRSIVLPAYLRLIHLRGCIVCHLL